MVNLKVYDGSDQYFLDLYEEDTVKLNLSIEDITNAEAKSVFSRAFRVPATRNNNLFFKHAFMINGIDYDVTVKKPAVILVDGAEFREGHIRLQKIYNNPQKGQIDYQIVFLGETRDFASAIGDSPLCELDLSALTHTFSGANVELSWEAYPSTQDAAGVAITPSFTNGLLNGDVIYPLVDFGLEGTESSSNPRIAVGVSHDFTNNNLPLNRLKPMVRAKAIVDAIFDSTDYEYEVGGFFDEDIFKQIYVSAWGNESSYLIDEGLSENIFSAIGNVTGGSNDWLDANVEISDPGNNYNPTTSTYTIPTGYSGTYTFNASCLYLATADTVGYPEARLRVYRNGTVVKNGASGANTTLTVSHTGPFTAGDTVRIYVEQLGIYDSESVTNQTFNCTLAPGPVNVNAQFDCDYKQIDFIKDLLTTFRLVMAPDRLNPKKFIIEPWVDYIATGDFYDWSDKLDRSQDIVLEPLFDTQTDQIMFNHEEDKDFINDNHLTAYKYVYGHLEFNSGNELLIGSREVKTNWAPTPMTQIEGVADTSPWIIPQVHAGVGEEHTPIKPKTRWLFYNGLHTTGPSHTWRLQTGPNSPYDIYPVVSYSSEWPLTTSGQILNWRNDIGYWGSNVSGYPPQDGSSLYDSYWSGYINSLYNKDARRLTATFILNNVDLQDMSFDDIIFVDGIYWRPEKIIDAPVGELSKVKVQLIKLLNYKYFA